jgi:lipopolysaccharide transport system permease protein
MRGELKVTEYSSESEVRHPGKLVARMFRSLWSSRSLAFSLVKRDLSAAYRQSFLGFAWAFIPSLLTAVTFSMASRNKVLNVAQTDIPYVAYVMFGVVLWQTFSESVLGPVTGLNAARSFITKISFPHEALFLAKIGEAIFNFAMKTILIAGIFIYFGILPSAGVFVAIIIILVMMIGGISLGLLIAPFSIIYQDFAKGLPLVLGLSMFATPVVYPMPTTDSFAARVVRANPMSYIIGAIRETTIYGSTQYSGEVMMITAGVVVLFVFSWTIFRLSMPYVIERCG